MLLFSIPCNGQMLVNSFMVGAGSGGGGGTLPTANRLFNHEADQNITQTSNNISAWGDLSGNSRNYAQATGANQPNWISSSEIQFNASTDFLSLSYTIAQPSTIYLVVKLTATGSDKYIWGDAAGTFLFWQASSSQFILSNNGGGNTITASGTYSSTTSYYLVTCVINGASSSIAVNGTAPTTGTLAAGSLINPFTLGAVTLSGGASPILFADVSVKADAAFSTQTTQEVTDTKEYFRSKYSLY